MDKKYVDRQRGGCGPNGLGSIDLRLGCFLRRVPACATAWDALEAAVSASAHLITALVLEALTSTPAGVLTISGARC